VDRSMLKRPKVHAVQRIGLLEQHRQALLF